MFVWLCTVASKARGLNQISREMRPSTNEFAKDSFRSHLGSDTQSTQTHINTRTHTETHNQTLTHLHQICSIALLYFLSHHFLITLSLSLAHTHTHTHKHHTSSHSHFFTYTRTASETVVR